MQIAGTRCSRCQQPIVFASDAKSCEPCGISVHLNCEPAAKCPQCRTPFTRYAPSKTDPLTTAFDPREKRSSNAVAPLLAALLAAITILIVFYLMTLT